MPIKSDQTMAHKMLKDFNFFHKSFMLKKLREMTYLISAKLR